MKKIKQLLLKIWFRYKYKNTIFDYIPKSVNYGSATARQFIIDNKKLIKIIYGNDFLREVILNYRSHFQPHKKYKVIKSYKQLIITRKNIYTSDVAITINILKNFNLTEEEENLMYELLYRIINSKYHISKSIAKYKAIEYVRKK